MIAAVNPYSGKHFADFFLMLVERLMLFFQGDLPIKALVSDEIQLLVLILLGLSLSFLGVFLVLKQMTMLANALSHTILLGIVLSYLIFYPFFQQGEIGSSFYSLKVLLVASAISGVLTTLCTQGLQHWFRLAEDASIGLVFTSFFAVGVILVTACTRNVHIGTEAIMGNIDALDVQDLSLVTWMAIGNLFVFLLGLRGWSASAFDPVFTSSIGWSVSGFRYLLMLLTAATAIAAFRAVGVLLFLAFLVGPVLIARLWARSLKKLLLGSFFVSAFCSLIAVALSRHLLTCYSLPLSTSGMVVTIFLVFYLLSLFARSFKTRFVFSSVGLE